MDQVWGPDGDDWCCKETLEGHESTAGRPNYLLVDGGETLVEWWVWNMHESLHEYCI